MHFSHIVQQVQSNITLFAGRIVIKSLPAENDYITI